MLPDAKQALVQIRHEIQPAHSTDRFRACVRTLVATLGATHGPGWKDRRRGTYSDVDDQVVALGSAATLSPSLVFLRLMVKT